VAQVSIYRSEIEGTVIYGDIIYHLIGHGWKSENTAAHARFEELRTLRRELTAKKAEA
jgi:hypothetical protein